MKFIKFTIEGYRAIKETEVLINDNLKPIIWVNESWKTTILQAILAFDKMSDRYNGWSHLKYDNRYESWWDKKAKITADILLENKDEIEEISDSLWFTLWDNIIKQLEEKLKKKEIIKLSRNFNDNSKNYSIDNIDISKINNKKLANKIYEMLPYILYFDDFSDRVPEQIEFKLDNKIKGKFSPKKIWRSDEVLPAK